MGNGEKDASTGLYFAGQRDTGIQYQEGALHKATQSPWCDTLKSCARMEMDGMVSFACRQNSGDSKAWRAQAAHHSARMARLTRYGRPLSSLRSTTIGLGIRSTSLAY